MTLIDSIGFIAAFCTTFSFAPQVIRVLKTNDTSALSLSMYVIFTFGVAMWFGYGLMRGDMAVVIANALTLMLASIILYKKVVNDLMRNTRSMQNAI